MEPTGIDILILMASTVAGGSIGGLLFCLILSMRDKRRPHICEKCYFTFMKTPGTCKRCSK
jgi:hypothetical protein